MESLSVEVPSSGAEWAAFTGADLDAKVAELNRFGRQVEAAIVGATEWADRSGHFETDGHRSVSGWLMATTNCTRGEATARTRTARLTRQLARVASEFWAGRVGVAQVRELARLAANPRVADQLPGATNARRNRWIAASRGSTTTVVGVSGGGSARGAIRRRDRSRGRTRCPDRARCAPSR